MTVLSMTFYTTGKFEVKRCMSVFCDLMHVYILLCTDVSCRLMGLDENNLHALFEKAMYLADIVIPQV